MEQNAEALSIIKSAKKNRNIAYSFMGLGIATATTSLFLQSCHTGNNIQHVVVQYFGAGIVLASIPYSKKSDRLTEKAVWTYNQNISTTIKEVKPELHINMTANGLGFTLTF